jgi:hypothetical protein
MKRCRALGYGQRAQSKELGDTIGLPVSSTPYDAIRDTNRPLISILSECASPSLTVHEMLPSYSRFQRFCATRSKSKKQNTTDKRILVFIKEFLKYI